MRTLFHRSLRSLPLTTLSVSDQDRQRHTNDTCQTPQVSLNEVERLIEARGWLEGPLTRALYASAGNDAKPMTFLHPAFLERQGATEIPAPSFLVYVDQRAPSSRERVPISFDDERTKIETTETIPIRVGTGRAYLLRCEFHSRELGARTVAILRVRSTNDQFLRLASREGWSPETFVGICDGCGGFGGNDHCENNFDPESSLPLKLGARWWVSDHFDRPLADLDPQDGATFGDPAGEHPATMTQVAFLSTLWRSKVNDQRRLRGGARIFSIEHGMPSGQGELPL